MIKPIVPISRFNKGEAGKIFDEVKSGGFKIVVKNNVPTCVLITPEKYQELMEKVEEYNLLTVAVKRMENVKDSDFIAS
ncbi:type II toxin-antitoxin system Phd/YefM family antitoxin [Clostridium sp. FP2]|uniref:type II toxin-antitoxin system Phd/YefM family antitoxin n=1 Tax=Clostridium TaxID=1485 RepID=UPI001C6EFC7D|nr:MULTISPECIES: type II toxin-antitoxin system Phd/YefM family antitoxin [Clostridium]MBW9158004.1 type II toxin-antitoxin system Phd/YefM family antitoxin [Clostridium tagluense]MBZ9622123.1 type II toxin-antitoxin system Phd/YefM family antitoxin [Clostridium sp. FP2]WLC66436.1 type II toxin-antitoxin system Phd/YefM family antitoxin [Clostridium tagluense]